MKGLSASVLFLACLVILVTKASSRVNLYHGSEHKLQANFIEHLHTVLDVPPIMTSKVHSLIDCAFKCLKDILCLSFNVATNPDANDLYECKPLNADKYHSPNSFKYSKEFNHHSILTACEKNSPCRNGGKCRPDYETQAYTCECVSGFAGNNCQIQVKTCQDLLELGMTKNGMYTIKPDEQGPLKVYCDQTTDGGGWTVLQRRVSPFNTSFNRNWEEYKTGFGTNLTGEFWLGNDNIHRLAATPVSFRVDFQENGGNKLHARYENFVVAGADDKYRWNMDSYTGDLSNAIYGKYWHTPHVERGMQFSTPDSDNDNCPGACSCVTSSGWWVNWCGLVDLNHSKAPKWQQRLSSSTYIWASFSEMKIRPK